MTSNEDFTDSEFDAFLAKRCDEELSEIARQYIGAPRVAVATQDVRLAQQKAQSSHASAPSPAPVGHTTGRMWHSLFPKVIAASLLVIVTTGAAYEYSVIRKLNEALDESHVRDAIDLQDFCATGRDTIAVRGSIDARYVREVTLEVPGSDSPRVLFSASLPAADHATRIPISETWKVELGTGRFTAVLNFIPFDDAPPEFFPEETRVRRRDFYADFNGVVTDPPPEEAQVAVTLDYLWFKGEPNYYRIRGRIARSLTRKQGWLVAYAEESRTYFVLTELMVDDKSDPPTFHSTFQLGMDRLDDQHYQLFAAFADDRSAMIAGQTAPYGFDWTPFERSQSLLKRNNGTDGFTSQSPQSQFKEGNNR